MCVVSNVGDYYGRTFPEKYPDWFPQPGSIPVMPQGVSQEEFDALKAEVKQLRKLLKMAKKIDAATQQPDCEMEAKVAMLKKLAELVGVDLGSVFAPKAAEK